MIVLHAHWTDGLLHLWGQEVPAETKDIQRPAGRSDGRKEPRAVSTLADEELRGTVGDAWDSLLVSGAASAHLDLLLPSCDGRLTPPLAEVPGVAGASPSSRSALQRTRVPTIAFGPADAVDLLTGLPKFTRQELNCGGSLRYWARVAELVLELLAKQRFVPAIHVGGDGRYRGYWRTVVNDGHTSARLRALIVAMPPVCRAFDGEGTPVQASALVENFLWTTVDALVRRCLEGDELARALHDHGDEVVSPQIRWLRALVRNDPHLTGALEECRSISETVQSWLMGLETPVHERACRTCLRLHTQMSADEPAASSPTTTWRLTLHVQATEDPTMIVDAARLWEDHADDPLILQRPFAQAREQLRADLARAARHFPPLEACTEPEGPLECRLTVEEAYRFLRDAAPVLEAEGLGVWAPQWWQEARPRLRMELEIRPLDDPAPVAGASMGLEALVGFDWRVALGDEYLSPKEITELAAAKAPLVQLRGRWTEVQAADLHAALRFLKKNRGGRMTVFEALRMSYAADELDTGLPVAGLRASGWIDRLLNASHLDDQVEQVRPLEGFHGTLRPYQIRGLQWLSFLARHGLGACLADDMGLGKTIQLIALWLHERESGESPGPTLLVVPMSLVGNWQREIARFAPTLRVMVHHGLERLTGQEFVAEAPKHDVVISTYGLTPRDREHLVKVEWHRVALDEAQNIKNPAAKQSATVRLLPCVHRVALTGTPVENRLSELWSIIDFLNPGYLGTATDFRRRFAVPVERHHDADRSRRLRHLIRPLVLRRLKDDPDVAVDLPEKLEMTVFCNLTREQAALYEAIVSEMLGQIDLAGGIQRRGLILASLVKLKQTCNHPAHLLADGSPLPHRSGKCDRLTEMLEEVLAEGHRALVFTQFRQMGNLLAKHLQESLDREMLFMHGGTPQKTRVEMVERFQGGGDDCPVFILSLKTGGVGLNLTAANHVFHFDRWWNPAVEDQATDRAHRIGQERQVQVHKFVCIGTLEERIAALIERKRSLARNIVGTGEEWITELSTAALRDLFALSREAIAEE